MELKHKVHDVVKITQVGSTKFKVGEMVKITTLYPKPPNPHYRARSLERPKHHWWIDPSWCEPTTNPPNN